MIYECKNCKKNFNAKGDYDRHMKKKKKCGVVDANVCIYCNTEFSKYYSLQRHLNDGRCREKLHSDNNARTILEKITKQYVDEKITVPELVNNIINDDNNNEKYLTEWYKLFCYMLEKNIHQQFENTNQQIENIKAEHDNTNNDIHVGDNTNNSNNNSNNTNTNTQINGNITNNIEIKVAPYGQEDISYITDEMYKKILKKGLKSVPALVENVHFNEDHPENHNINISNKHDKYVSIYDGKQWTADKKNKVIDNMIIDNIDTLTDACERICKEDDIESKKFHKFLDKQGDEETLNNLKEDIKLILYNNIKKTSDEILGKSKKLLALETEK